LQRISVSAVLKWMYKRHAVGSEYLYMAQKHLCHIQNNYYQRNIWTHWFVMRSDFLPPAAEIAARVFVSHCNFKQSPTINRAFLV
jgi:hypothetical protein